MPAPSGPGLAAHSLPSLALVHCQWANHEVGTLQPVHEVVAPVPGRRRAGARRRRRRAAGTFALDLAELGADLVSLSAHKIGGLPGAGALIIRRGSRFDPLIVGGEQERARAGRARGPAGPGGLRGGGGGPGRR